MPLLNENSGGVKLASSSGDGDGGGSSSCGGVCGGGGEFRGDDHSVYAEEIITKKTSGVARAVCLLATCYSSADKSEMSLSASTKLEDLVPPCYVHAGNIVRLIKVRRCIFDLVLITEPSHSYCHPNNFQNAVVSFTKFIHIYIVHMYLP